MKKINRGFSTGAVIAIVAIVLIVLAGWYFLSKPQTQTASTPSASSQNTTTSQNTTVNTPPTSPNVGISYADAKSLAPADISNLQISQPGPGSSYQAAVGYCSGLSEKNLTGWRLPTLSELKGIYQQFHTNSAYRFLNIWSSTLDTISSKDQHYAIGFAGDPTPAAQDDGGVGQSVVCVH
jgi:hypothetical protein